MDELVTYLARRLVDEPDAVQVESETDGDTVRLRLTVAPDDVGKVIGKQRKAGCWAPTIPHWLKPLVFQFRW